jgi:hypothetical protein
MLNVIIGFVAGAVVWIPLGFLIAAKNANQAAKVENVVNAATGKPPA